MAAAMIPGFTPRTRSILGPTGIGTNGQVLTSDGAGGTSWATPSSGVTDHGALTGLSDDDHTQYALLAGRSGGQTLVGGTASGDDLTLQSTSHATKGSVYIGSTKLEVSTANGTRIQWPTVTTGETPGLEWSKAGSFGVQLVVNDNGALQWVDTTSGSGVNRVVISRAGAMTVSGTVTLGGLVLGTSAGSTAFPMNSSTYTGGKTDSITFGSYRQDGVSNNIPRLAITTAIGSGNGVAEVAVRNAVLRVAQLADTSAPNDSIYYSTDASKLVYKDSSGVVNSLY